MGIGSQRAFECEPGQRSVASLVSSCGEQRGPGRQPVVRGELHHLDPESNGPIGIRPRGAHQDCVTHADVLDRDDQVGCGCGGQGRPLVLQRRLDSQQPRIGSLGRAPRAGQPGKRSPHLGPEQLVARCQQPNQVVAAPPIDEAGGHCRDLGRGGPHLGHRRARGGAAVRGLTDERPPAASRHRKHVAAPKPRTRDAARQGGRHPLPPHVLGHRRGRQVEHQDCRPAARARRGPAELGGGLTQRARAGVWEADRQVDPGGQGDPTALTERHQHEARRRLETKQVRHEREQRSRVADPQSGQGGGGLRHGSSLLLAAFAQGFRIGIGGHGRAVDSAPFANQM